MDDVNSHPASSHGIFRVCGIRRRKYTHKLNYLAPPTVILRYFCALHFDTRATVSSVPAALRTVAVVAIAVYVVAFVVDGGGARCRKCKLIAARQRQQLDGHKLAQTDTHSQSG